MNIELYKCFHAIIDNGTVSKAAEALFKTQPTVTKSIQKLEKQLGIKLFDRDGYRLILTQAGKSIELQTRNLSSMQLELTQTIQSLQDGYKPNLSIVLDRIIPFRLLAPIISKYSQEYPTSNLYIHTKLLDEGYRMVELSEADLGLVAMEKIGGNLLTQVVGSIDVANVVSTRAPKEFWNTMPQAVLSDMNELGASSNVIENNCYYIRDLEQKIVLIKSGICWGRVPVCMVKSELESGLLNIADVPGVTKHQEVPLIVVSKGENSTENIKFLRESISAELSYIISSL